MSQELNIDFHSADKFIIHFDSRSSELLDFQIAFEDKEQKAIKWYFEVYATDYTTEVDDDDAQSVVESLPVWGTRLFDAVFGDRVARRLYEDFQRQGGLLTISATQPTILALPWELLFDPESTFLYNCKPLISIRRRLARTDKARQIMVVEPKKRLRVLFVISRPSEAGFIDPRADAKAVLAAALNEDTSGRFEVEFLRPPTLDNLIKRLECRAQYRKFPAVDVLHFDGHGVFTPLEASQGYAHKQTAETKKADGEPHFMGYLLFEDKESKTHLVDAKTLGDMLTQQNVVLVVLSACQSAMMGGDEAMSSVAARLIHAGMPAVLAMTYSVLVETTRRLFTQFYESLAYGAGIGEALDDARRFLYSHPERGERQRLKGPITLKVSDWFLPALYQVGDDNPLLLDEDEVDEDEPVALEQPFASNLPELQEAGFVGRKQELWIIEQAFVHGTRRLTLSGFGGQGKTYLAIEAGQWLCQTGLFEAVCFIDYASFQGTDAVSLAVSTLATVLEVSLIDEKASRDVMHRVSTLLILDNLEAIDKVPLRELLDVAEIWSKTGKCRVLLTTRSPDFQHPAYPTEGSLKHQALPLTGLTENDALDYFQQLLELPPAPSVDLPPREVILELFKQVGFHPLSIGLLGKQLKIRRPAELGLRLEKFIAETPDDPLLASLNLSLDKVDGEAKRWLPRLGVFQGGAFESELLEITELSEEQWQTLRTALETTGLIQAEHLPSFFVPYIRFHPTLAPALKTRLSAEELAQLLARHQACYYQLSGYLSSEDLKNPHQARAIARRELPNLLYAVDKALNNREKWAVEFADRMNKFLDIFGLKRDRHALTSLMEKMVEQTDFQNWCLARSNRGELLYAEGHYQEAQTVFQEVLKRILSLEVLGQLDDISNYKRCFTLSRLGRCFKMQGLTKQAIECYRQGLVIATQLEYSFVKRQMGALQTDLADALVDMGDYDGARKAYESALTIAKEQNDNRQIAAVEGQLGTLALEQNNLQEAAERYSEALAIFQRLNEPELEAMLHHQLGMVYQKAQQWDAAEQAYRESARIKESQGNLAAVATTWNQLATVNRGAGKFEAAEAWFRKAIEGAKAARNRLQVSRTLDNLADLLQTNYPNRLQEARQLAEESLVIKNVLDPNISEIWTTYTLLAEIIDQQNDSAQVRIYHNLARKAKASFSGTQYELLRYKKTIIDVVVIVLQSEQRELEKPLLQKLEKDGWHKLVVAIRRIFNGERNEESLWENLNLEDSMIISAILRGI